MKGEQERVMDGRSREGRRGRGWKGRGDQRRRMRGEGGGVDEW